MRHFGTFKIIEIYLILSAIFWLFTFNQLCEKKEEEKLWMGYSNTNESDHHNEKPIIYSASAPLIAKVAALVDQDVKDSSASHDHGSHHGPHVHGLHGDTASNRTLIMAPPAASKKNDKPMIASSTFFVPESRAAVKESSNNDLKKYNHLPPIDPSPTIKTFPDKLPVKIDASTAAPVVGNVKVPAVVDARILVPPRPSPPKEILEEPMVLLRPIVTPPDQIFGIFGDGNDNDARVKRETGISGDGKAQENQTHFDVKCIKADTIFKNMNPFNNNLTVIQQIFAWRFWGILLLAIHLILVLYHSIVICIHDVPTSQRFNRIFAFIGFIIWNLITFWIIYQWLIWNNKFLHQTSTIFPSIPTEFYAFLILSIAMNAILLYEFITPVIFLSYDITPPIPPRRGYIPAAQSDNNEYNGIIRNLEAASQHSIESPNSLPRLIRSSESHIV